MKKATLPSKKSVMALFAVRIALVIGIVMFTFSIGNSQTVIKNEKTVKPVKSEIKDLKTTETDNTIVTPVADIIPVAPWAIPGFHAPAVDDPNFGIKMQEWMKNYPDEYKACIKMQDDAKAGVKAEVTTTTEAVIETTPEYVTPANIKAGASVTADPADEAIVVSKLDAGVAADKMGAHAPSADDWTNADKMQEWMTNYPDEYNAFINRFSTTPPLPIIDATIETEKTPTINIDVKSGTSKENK